MLCIIENHPAWVKTLQWHYSVCNNPPTKRVIHCTTFYLMEGCENNISKESWDLR
uniref:Uncharacterized protein n=1 Tax=Anguilla anguilla TaxID=7936 RepID=A0A0E9T696_ANGAN